MSYRAARFLAPLLILGIHFAHAQLLHPSGPLPSFEVSTVKPGDGCKHGPGEDTGEVGNKQIVCISSNFTIRELMSGSYNLPTKLIFGGPAWIDKDKYTIQAKIPDDLFAQMQKMNVYERRMQVSLLFQSLLAERFKLKVHIEKREETAYELLAGKTLKIARNKDDDPAPNQMTASLHDGVPRLKAQNLSMPDLAYWLQYEILEQPVVDKTGIAGRYTFTLDFAPEDTVFGRLRHSTPADPTALGAPSIFTAIQSDIGLRLQRAKDPIEVVVIDSIEQPSQN